MRPTKEQWQKLSDKAQQVAAMLNELKHEAAMLAFECEDPLRLKLLDQIEKQLDGANPGFFAGQCRPYKEWVGGDSWKWREPQICVPQHYYREE